MELRCNLTVLETGLIEFSTCSNYFTLHLYDGKDHSGRPMESDFVMMNKDECTKLLEVIHMVSGCDLPATFKK